MNTSYIWYKLPLPLVNGGTNEELPEIEGNSFIINSGTHKYIHVARESDQRAFDEWTVAQRVTGGQVTVECELPISADVMVQSEFFGHALAKPRHRLGDRVSTFLRAIGFRKPCAGCEERRRWLNNL